MNVPREQVYAAVFNAVANHPTVRDRIQTSGRLLKPLADLDADKCPALFMVQKGELAEHVAGLPIKWTLQVEFVLYVDTINDLTTLPATTANQIMDAIEESLAPKVPSFTTTLNGLVKYCTIRGQLTTDEGLLGPRALWVVPVNILVP